MPTALVRTVLGVAALVAGSAASAPAAAGPINPPAGPVAPTGKTLTEVEPRTPLSAATTPGDADSVYRITQPGSYYLTANLVGASGKRGIEIMAGDVSIDLNGFAVLGVPGSFEGIAWAATGASGLRVHSGTVSGWGGAGIDLAFSDSEGAIVEGVVASGNGLYGIRGSSQGIVRGCAAQGNASFGVISFNGGLVESCRVDENGADGILSGGASVITGCHAADNAGNGIRVSGGSSVLGCTASDNGLAGIAAGTGCVVRGCAAVFNSSDGISAAGSCLVSGNVARANGSGGGTGAGIRVSGADNRIEGNQCLQADFGVQVQNSGNIIVRNTCSGNGTNWEIAPNNYYGPIVDRTGVLTLAVSGNAAASSLATTDANANFTY